MQWLAAQGATDRVGLDLTGAVATLAEHSRRFIDASGMERASYFLGDAGVLLLQWKNHPSPDTADALFALVQGNLHNKAREALWGSPGTLVAALHMVEATQEGAG